MTNSGKHGTLSKISYGFADIYGGGAFVVISTFYTVFLTKSLGMHTALAGTIPLIGKIWDAITDPLMGNIADRTKSRFGAKRFWMLVGSIISAITFIVMWIPFMAGGSQIGQYIFYILMYMLFSTGFTIVMVPYNGLLPDMVEDYTSRAKFSSIRMIFSALGAIIAGLVPTIMIKDNTNKWQYLNVAIIFAVIFFNAIVLTFLGTWERQKEVQKVTMKETFTQSFTVFKSHSFRLFIGIFIFGQAAADFITGLAVYYIDDVLHAYGGGNFTKLMGVILISQFLGMILFAPIMAATSKKFPILLGTPIRIVATFAMLFFSHEGAPFVIILALSFVIGLAMAGTSTSIYAILSDLTEVDELITSINRPGICSGMATFTRKIAAGLSSAMIGILLAMVGYDEKLASSGQMQSMATQKGIANVYVFAQIILLVITLCFTVLFPVTKKEYDIIRKEISRRKGEDTSTASAEEIAVCEKVTGYKYDQLWNKDNAYKIK
ncbi:MFS transporter [Butyrivibrio sp. VCB2006]|uniref:MFS transporter n=1 Tax=Butyrivibrio sp. VCB2006 TaxID=1280679 RepID=UPI00040986D9|nr:MFS transporter [Butyrivibrio sp. VCB2006]